MINMTVMLFLLAAFLSSCNLPVDKLNGDYISWEDETPMATLPFNLDYIKLEDINPEDVEEIKLNPGIVPHNLIVEETEDGFILRFIKKFPFNPFTMKHEEIPVIQKYGDNDKMIWAKGYNYPVTEGAITNLSAFKDGSFIFKVQNHPVSFIIKCNKDGNIVWKRDLDHHSWNSYMFINENGEIYLVDEVSYPDNFVVTKFDKKGNKIKEKSFGNNVDLISSVKYSKELGIIVLGWQFIACIDEDLNLNWVLPVKDNAQYCDQLVLEKDSIYIIGYYSAVTKKTNPGFLLKLDKQGEQVWINQEVHDDWGAQEKSLALLENGNIIISSGYHNKGVLIILDEHGNEINRIEDLQYYAREIHPLSEGSFIIIAERQIKTVPQPAYLSSIWMDTELVVVKYSSDYSIEWRKTYDKYDNEIKDFIMPLKSGKLIVEDQ